MFMTYKKRPYRMCDDDYICQAMEMVAKGGGVLQLHCESGNIIEYLENKLIAEGHTHPTDFPSSYPDWAEEEAINRAVKMAMATRCPTYVVHLSTQLGLERIKQAQGQGQPVWTETCPQYLLLSDAEMARYGPLAKIGPPLRPDDGPDRDALWRGLERGHVSIVASDHAPYPQELKQVGWDNIFVDAEGWSVPFGSPGVETIVPLMYSEGVVKRGLPIWWLARALSENPARIYGLYPRKEVIQVGSDADLLILGSVCKP
jgi:dihydroorotase-like cyclic amidohydrolase